MKKFFGIFILIITVSCSQDAIIQDDEGKESPVPTYDTLPIDSFSAGATSIDVARQIKLSSQKHQDSLREIRVNLEKEKLLKKETDEKLKAEKTVEEAKKKAENLKKEKKKTEVENSPSTNPSTP